jgi:hypothetical protein
MGNLDCDDRGARDGQRPADGEAEGTLASETQKSEKSGWGDLNPRPLDPQSSALTKLRHSPWQVDILLLTKVHLDGRFFQSVSRGSKALRVMASL